MIFKNRRVFIFSVLCTMSFILMHLQGCTSSNADKNQEIVLGLSADYPPFEFKKNGEVVGIDVDIARAIVSDLGYRLVVQDMDFSTLIPALQSGRVDFVMSGMTITEERKKNIDFSDFYYFASFALLINQTTPFTQESDLQGKRLGVQLGSTMEKYAREKAKVLPGIEIVSLGKNITLVQELKAGRIDGMIVEDVQAQEFVQANSFLKQFRLVSSEEGYAAAFSKHSKSALPLKEKFNSVLQKLKASGEIERIKKKWLGK